MTTADIFDAPMPRRDLPWGTAASVGLHAGLALVLVLASPLRTLVVPPPVPVSVEIVTQAQFEALQPKPETPPVVAAPEADAAAPHAAGEAQLPQSTPPRAALKRSPTITATKLYTAGLLREPGMERIRKGLRSLAGSERVVQLCNIEGLEQIRRAAPNFDPDTLVSYAMADTAAAGLSLAAPGGAFRSRRKWYGVAFTCTVGADLESVTAFQFTLGDPIPEDQWEDHSLNAEDSDE
jgi:hypothetical protein